MNILKLFHSVFLTKFFHMTGIKHILRRDRRLGVEGQYRYDLPLDRNAGTDFIVLLIALMAFLATIALAGSFALESIGERWSSGLENKVTIEISPENPDGELLKEEEMDKLTQKVTSYLQNNTSIKNFEVLGNNAVQALIEPWLGEGVALEDFPLPRLVSLELHTNDQNIISEIQRQLTNISTQIQLDTHEEWLGDLLRLTGVLQTASIFIVFLVGGIAITALGGAIRSRMAIHRKDVELLHLMGASDHYISRQFQRHAWIIALKGSLAGVLAAIIILFLLGIYTDQDAQSTLPDFSLSFQDLLMFLFLPALAAFIASFTARFTVLRSLSAMP